MTAEWMMGFFNVMATIGSLLLIWFVTWVFVAKPDSMWEDEDNE